MTENINKKLTKPSDKTHLFRTDTKILKIICYKNSYKGGWNKEEKEDAEAQDAHILRHRGNSVTQLVVHRADKQTETRHLL